MMIMVSNNTSAIVSYFAGRFPGKIGHLSNPTRWFSPPYYLPWALDNGAFAGFDKTKFLYALEKATLIHSPIFVVVPDVVGDAEATLRLWHEWEPIFRGRLAFRTAFACQDGMEPQDVPKEAHCCFIGGSTEWKWKNAHRFKGVRDHLHVGRVNGTSGINLCKQMGADSIDGTGFFRVGPKRCLIDYFEGGLNAEIFREDAP